REQMELSRQRILTRLTTAAHEAGDEALEPAPEARESRRPFRPLVAAAALAMVFVIAGFTAIVWRFAAPVDRPAMAEAVTGTLYRIAGGESRVIPAGERIESGALIRSDGDGKGAVLALTD